MSVREEDTQKDISEEELMMEREKGGRIRCKMVEMRVWRNGVRWRRKRRRRNRKRGNHEC